MTTQRDVEGQHRRPDLATELGYAYRAPGAVHRAARALASSRAGTWLFSRTEVPADRALLRLSKGRATIPSVLARLPVLTLTTTGRRTGEQHDTLLLGVPFDGTLALIGTNFAQANTPAWAYNLEADPHAVVTYRGTRLDVVARPATVPERGRILAAAHTVYEGFEKYQERITGRRVRIFVLERPEP